MFSTTFVEKKHSICGYALDLPLFCLFPLQTNYNPVRVLFPGETASSLYDLWSDRCETVSQGITPESGLFFDGRVNFVWQKKSNLDRVVCLVLTLTMKEVWETAQIGTGTGVVRALRPGASP